VRRKWLSVASLLAATFVLVPGGPATGNERAHHPDVRIELVWESEADLDLHLLHPNGDWGDRQWDCHWISRNPNWGNRGRSDDDPLLEIDDIDGFGPEVITLSHLETRKRVPASVTWSDIAPRTEYQVGVLDFFDPADGRTRATVRIWVRGLLAAELTTEFPGDLHFWTVAAIRYDGRQITVVPIDEVAPLF